MTHLPSLVCQYSPKWRLTEPPKPCGKLPALIGLIISRLALTPAEASSDDHCKRIVIDDQEIECLFIDGFIPGYGKPPERIVTDVRAAWSETEMVIRGAWDFFPPFPAFVAARRTMRPEPARRQEVAIEIPQFAGTRTMSPHRVAAAASDSLLMAPGIANRRRRAPRGP